MHVIAPFTFMAAASLSTDAFAPTFRMPSRSTLGHGGALQTSDKPLTELCEITKEACEAVAPMLIGEIRFVPADLLRKSRRPCNTCFAAV